MCNTCLCHNIAHVIAKISEITKVKKDSLFWRVKCSKILNSDSKVSKILYKNKDGTPVMVYLHFTGYDWQVCVEPQY